MSIYVYKEHIQGFSEISNAVCKVFELM